MHELGVGKLSNFQFILLPCKQWIDNLHVQTITNFQILNNQWTDKFLQFVNVPNVINETNKFFIGRYLLTAWSAFDIMLSSVSIYGGGRTIDRSHRFCSTRHPHQSFFLSDLASHHLELTPQTTRNSMKNKTKVLRARLDWVLLILSM